MGKSPFKVETKGDFTKTLRFLKKLQNGEFYEILDKYGQLGVESLRDHTPVDTGRAADSWFYEVNIDKNEATITWCNSDIEHGENVILLLEFGHATPRGHYVSGLEIVEPSLKPIMDQLVKDIWREVERS